MMLSAVKLEGGREICEQIKAITQAGIPVMAHLGLTPQSIHAFGGFKVQGKTLEKAQKLLDDARAVEQAGAFSVVLECVPAALAEKVTQTVGIATIGIGAGKGCNGQVLVYQDLLGMFSDFTPKFVKKYADVGSVMNRAFETYISDLDNGTFPEEKHTYAIDKEIIEKLV